MNRPTYPLAAVPTLLDRGAHFVLVTHLGKLKTDGTQRKSALRPHWQHLRPTFIEIRDHINEGGLLGIVPASLGRAVLDVDRGDPIPLICAHLPWFVARSQQPGRVHLWYRDDAEHRRGGNWHDGHGCGGDLLAGTGYVILWGNALQELTEALDYGDHNGQATFDAVAAALTWRSSKRSKTKAKAPAAKDRTRNPSVSAHQDLSNVSPGHRNVSLFDDVRIWSYHAYRQFEHYHHFADAALQRALKGRDQIPILEDFDAEEATAVARSVATWTWEVRPTSQSRLSARDTSGPDQKNSSQRSPSTGEHEYQGDPSFNSDSEVQRWRRGQRTRLDAVRVGHRQAQVAARSCLGVTVPNLATAFDVTVRTIWRDLAVAGVPSRRQARRMLQAKGERRKPATATATADRLLQGGSETSLPETERHGGEDGRPSWRAARPRPTPGSDAPLAPPLILGWCHNIRPEGRRGLPALTHPPARG